MSVEPTTNKSKADESNASEDNDESRQINPEDRSKNTNHELNTTINSDISTLNADAFNALVTYVQDDLSSVADDYKLLEKMNKVAITKYAEMKEITTTVHIEMVKINDRYRSLVPYLEQIDQIEESVASLEEVAYRLDAYSKRLEAKFKQIEKR